MFVWIIFPMSFSKCFQQKYSKKGTQNASLETWKQQKTTLFFCWMPLAHLNWFWWPLGALLVLFWRPFRAPLSFVGNIAGFSWVPWDFTTNVSFIYPSWPTLPTSDPIRGAADDHPVGVSPPARKLPEPYLILLEWYPIPLLKNIRKIFCPRPPPDFGWCKTPTVR